MLLSRLSQSISGSQIVGEDVFVENLVLDSREIQSGDLFCAVLGLVTNGLDFVESAIQKGAMAVALESEIKHLPVSQLIVPDLKARLGELAASRYPLNSLKSLVGVTGTNGKTSVCSFIRQLGEALASSSVSIGTLGIEAKDQLIPLKNTTPDVLTVRRTLSELQSQGTQLAAMEVSSHALVQGRVNNLPFKTAIFTNLSQDHLDYHGDMARYAEAKSRLFSWPTLTSCILNFDDPEYKRMHDAVRADGVNIFSYSLQSDQADAYFSAVKANEEGFNAKLHFQGMAHHVSIPLMGQFNLSNVLAATLALVCEGMPLEQVIDAYSTLKPAEGRTQAVPNNYSVKALVDYAHTPDALIQLLSSFKAESNGRLLVVFGCGGDRDKTKRPLMAEAVDRFADYCWITSDNPRHEQPERICEETARGIKGQSFDVVVDRALAISTAVLEAKAGDTLIIAGKGHEKTQQIGDEFHPFDDVAVLRSAFERRASL